MPNDMSALAVAQGPRIFAVSRQNLAAIVKQVAPELVLVNRVGFAAAAESFLAVVDEAASR